MNIAIVGGGAAGLVCAIAAARNSNNKKQNKITVFESKDRVGKKILATGNGRCNILNTDKKPFYFSENGFHKFAVERFDAQNNIEFFASMGLFTRSDEEGRVYPLSNQASTVLDFLRRECDILGVEMVTDCEITSVRKKGEKFILNDEYTFDKVVLSCGGKAAVKKFNGYDLLKQLNHPVTDIKPSLTKINTKDTSDVKQLQGIRHKSVLSLYNRNEFITQEKGELLFAKYGISGIAVMQLSSFIARINDSRHITVSADFVPDFKQSFLIDLLKESIRHNPIMPSGELLSGFMPKKLSETVVRRSGVDISSEVRTLSEKELIKISRCAKSYKFEVDSLRGFDDAQVTAGGADTAFINCKTMESLKVKGLYIIGELLNVDGLCGGYNLMWAWSSARLCAENVIK